MVLHIILADILLIACIFPRPFGARKNTTQLAKYPRVLYVKPSNKIYILTALEEKKNPYWVSSPRDSAQYGISFSPTSRQYKAVLSSQNRN